MTENIADEAPQQGRASTGAMQVRESAPENVPLKDALGQEPQRLWRRYLLNDLPTLARLVWAEQETPEPRS